MYAIKEQSLESLKYGKREREKKFKQSLHMAWRTSVQRQSPIHNMDKKKEFFP